MISFTGLVKKAINRRSVTMVIDTDQNMTLNSEDMGLAPSLLGTLVTTITTIYIRMEPNFTSNFRLNTFELICKLLKIKVNFDKGVGK
jgi:hypothetical protein